MAIVLEQHDINLRFPGSFFSGAKFYFLDLDMWINIVPLCL